MGRSTPVRDLECSRCKKKWSRQYALSNWNPTFKRWNAVQVVEQQGSAVLCRCDVCGYEYKSRSAAAWRRIMGMRENGRG